MNAKDLDPTYLVQSFLKAARDAKVEATVVYFTPENNARGAAEIATNRGNAAVARAMSVLDRHGIKKAAIALHDACSSPDGGSAARLRCSHPITPWDQLSASLQADHVATATVIARALAAGASVPDDSDTGNSTSGLIV